MPKRKSGTFRVDASEVQGDESFVELRTVRYGEFRLAQKGELKDDEVLQKHVLEWNFVDDEGVPMPQVRDEPEIVFALTMPEKNFLIDALLNGPDAKN